MEFPIRRSLRLRNYDYSTAGGYFITICTDQKKCILSHIEQGTELDRASIQLTRLGYIAKETIMDLQTRYSISIDSFVIMPNHIHMIVVLEKCEKIRTIGQIIGAYKSLVTKQWRELCNANGIKMEKLWQRNYYEHVIRNDSDYWEKTKYIEENPDKWSADREYISVI